MMDLVQISKHSCNIVLPTLGLDPISDKPHGLQLRKPIPNVLAPVFAPPWEEGGAASRDLLVPTGLISL